MDAVQPSLIEASLSEPHINIYIYQVHAACLSVCLSIFLSVRMFKIRKFTRAVLIYGVPSIVDCSVYGYV